MQILCVKNKGYLHFCALWGFRGGDLSTEEQEGRKRMKGGVS